MITPKMRKDLVLRHSMTPTEELVAIARLWSVLCAGHHVVTAEHDDAQLKMSSPRFFPGLTHDNVQRPWPAGYAKTLSWACFLVCYPGMRTKFKIPTDFGDSTLELDFRIAASAYHNADETAIAWGDETDFPSQN